MNKTIKLFLMSSIFFLASITAMESNIQSVSPLLEQRLQQAEQDYAQNPTIENEKKVESLKFSYLLARLEKAVADYNKNRTSENELKVIAIDKEIKDNMQAQFVKEDSQVPLSKVPVFLKSVENRTNGKVILSFTDSSQFFVPLANNYYRKKDIPAHQTVEIDRPLKLVRQDVRFKDMQGNPTKADQLAYIKMSYSGNNSFRDYFISTYLNKSMNLVQSTLYSSPTNKITKHFYFDDKAAKINMSLILDGDNLEKTKIKFSSFPYQSKTLKEIGLRKISQEMAIRIKNREITIEQAKQSVPIDLQEQLGTLIEKALKKLSAQKTID